MEWLWPGHLPLGQLVLLDGDPGLGKSLLALDLCARISSGRPFPDGAAQAQPANALILNAEDNARELILPRLQAARANLERVMAWSHEPGEPWFRLPADLGQLDDTLLRLGPRLVVLDPLTAFLDSNINLSSEHEVRRALSPLADLAAKHGCTILLVRHLNKSGNQHALYRGLHSIGIIAACRLAWLVGRDPRFADRFILAQEKTNLSTPQPSLSYTITTHTSGQAVIDWLGPAPLTATELLTGGSSRNHLRARACEFLMALLKDGPRPTRDIAKAARQQDISARTLRRARADLNITSQTVGDFVKRRTYWLLPGQTAPENLYDELQKETEEELRRVIGVR